MLRAGGVAPRWHRPQSFEPSSLCVDRTWLVAPESREEGARTSSARMCTARAERQSSTQLRLRSWQMSVPKEYEGVHPTYTVTIHAHGMHGILCYIRP
jgi:hypothetical protein